MAHALSNEELSSFRDAFGKWDITDEGTIRAGDLCKVIEFLGEDPSPDLQRLFGRPDVENNKINFDEFLTIAVGSPWRTVCYEQDKTLLEAIAEVEDGSGHVHLRAFLRAVDQYMEEGGYEYTDEELLDLYRNAFDVSFFEAVGGSLPPGMIWKVFEEEFADTRGIQRPANVESAVATERPADDGESTCEMADMVHVTLVDLGGKQLLVDTIASTWSVESLQQHIETVVGLPVHRQILYLAGEEGRSHGLSPSGVCLSKAGVSDGSTLLLIARDELKLDYKKFVAQLMDLAV